MIELALRDTHQEREREIETRALWVERRFIQFRNDDDEAPREPANRSKPSHAGRPIVTLEGLSDRRLTPFWYGVVEFGRPEIERV